MPTRVVISLAYANVEVRQAPGRWLVGVSLHANIRAQFVRSPGVDPAHQCDKVQQCGAIGFCLEHILETLQNPVYVVAYFS